MPVAGHRKFLFDYVTDQKDLGSAKDITDYESGKTWYEYHGDTADDTRDT